MVTLHTSPTSHCGITVEFRTNPSACIQPAQSQTAQLSFSITIEQGIAQCHCWGKTTLTISDPRLVLQAMHHELCPTPFAMTSPWQLAANPCSPSASQVFENVLFRVGQGGLFTSWDETVYAILLNLHIVSFEPGADKIPRMDRASLQAKRQTPGGTELRNCLRAVTIEASSAWQFWNTCLYLNHLSCFSYYIILYYTQYIYIFNIYII